MKEKRIERLARELKFLLKEERQKELALYEQKLENDKDIKKIAAEIYQKHGIDYNKLNNGVFSSLTENINDFIELFKSKDKNIKRKMIIEIIYMILLFILLKVPFDLVEDIGYSYIEVLSTNSTFYMLWHIAFLVLYTIVLICVLLVTIKNFNSKYKNLK